MCGGCEYTFWSIWSEHDQVQPTVCRILQHIGVNIYGNQIEACHRMDKNTDRIIVKFSSRKDCEHTMRVKKNWKILMLLTWTFQQGQSSILMTVCVLLIEDCGIKPRNYGTRIKFFFFFTVNGTVRIRLQEKGPYGIITHIDDLKQLIPEKDFSMFWLDCIVSRVCTL